MQMWNVDGCSGNIENVRNPKKKVGKKEEVDRVVNKQ